MELPKSRRDSENYLRDEPGVKEESDSAKLKSLLSVLPHERTTHGISLAQTLLHNNQAFQCMPHIVQLEICQAAVYQRYEAKTTVIRKGHQPEGCYFVVTGKLTAKSNDASSIVQNSITEVLNEIEEGDLFGVTSDFCIMDNRKTDIAFPQFPAAVLQIRNSSCPRKLQLCIYSHC